jgi:aspartyl-tRNA(Asn)/glutamyl-tRNA(Gln) amidotransferase subunit A
MMQERAADYGRAILERLAVGLFLTSGDYLDALRARRRIRDGLLDVLGGVDALLMPAVPVVAPVAGQWVQAGPVMAPPQRFMVRNTFLFNHTGLPAISVPCGTSDELPVGLQIAGRPWEEGTVLRIAGAVERITA